MAIDQTKAWRVTAQLMGNLEQTFGNAEDAEIRSAIVTVSVKYGEDNTLLWNSTPNMAIHEALGLLGAVQVEVERFARGEYSEEDQEEEDSEGEEE